MGQRWDAAIALAGEDPPADLGAAVAEELIALWSDLSDVLLRSAGAWTLACDQLVVRIVMLSRLTATTSSEWVPEPLLASGIYQGILTSAGLSFSPPPGCEPSVLGHLAKADTSRCTQALQRGGLSAADSRLADPLVTAGAAGPRS